MKLYLTLLAFALLTVFASAGEVDDKVYRESQEAYQRSLVMSQKSDAAYQKERRIVAIGGAAVICGLIIFFIVPMQRLQKRHAAKSIEVAIDTKRVLEEIRELLKKNA